jgi:hypothetical protein
VSRSSRKAKLEASNAGQRSTTGGTSCKYRGRYHGVSIMYYGRYAYSSMYGYIEYDAVVLWSINQLPLSYFTSVDSKDMLVCLLVSRMVQDISGDYD